ncbi:hypothetical protein [Chryseolinea lacunae]|uniref:FecR protein domain-containing protein n=1 Tax=Chryseolinea lacunae TaxID=2801331 RepID=A0ABS1KVD4_9BACT|nr:hypothetical protein [Chryseolinea lacunae]MBL0743158.1 hypothetical protein [Chryseolinea lacunae]
MSATERDYIVLYRTQVEQRLMLGSSDGKVKQRDLEYLATHIESKCNVKLSISTLKRLWKDEYAQDPHPSTLDALASALDFADWQSFKKANAQNMIHAFPPVAPPAKKEQARSAMPWVVVVLVVIAGGTVAMLGFRSGKKTLTLPGNIPFRADKTVTHGVPNTVMFNYDVSNIDADSFFIQQSWNPRNRVRIDPKRNYLSSIYYTPGFHHARLMVNDSVVAFARVHIKTDGWFPMLKYDLTDNRAVYLDRKTMITAGAMAATEAQLKAANVDTQKEFFLRYYNSRDFEGVTSDAFDLETRVRGDSLMTQVCPLIELMMVCEEGIFFVPLTTKGCVSNLALQLGEVYQNGRDTNLSALGVPLHEWQTLRIRNENHEVTILLNGQPMHQLSYRNNFGKMVGFIYTFNVPGAVDFIRLRNGEGKVVYADEFD